MSITVASISKQVETNKYPNMYPDPAFVAKHRKIIEDYKAELYLYKTACYKELNTYYKTGEVIIQNCSKTHLEQAMSNAGKTGLSLEEQVIVVAKRLEELWNKVVPLPHDIIVYRGIRRGTIGQNLFTGKCIKSRLYDLDMHRFCAEADLEEPRLWVDRKPNEDPRPYVYETLGFTSVTTDIAAASQFADIEHGTLDTLMALRLPAGTKFILPLSDDSSEEDDEWELILFPQHNTYVLNSLVLTKDIWEHAIKRVDIYIGTFCNDLNIYRPIESPKLRNLRVKFLEPELWRKNHALTHPLAIVSDIEAMCPQHCEEKLHFCDPETEKCVGDDPESLKKIQDWWRRENIKGKCTAEKVNSCVDNFLACDPDTGDCIPGPYNRATARRVLNWATPETIKAEQKPRYNCTPAKISKCANKRKLCNPYKKGVCTKYDIHNLYWFNNGLPAEELKKFVPDFLCSKADIKECADKYGRPCNPVTGRCAIKTKYFTWDNKLSKHKWEDILARQELLKKKVDLPKGN